ncbi:hypothetical protein [Methanohalobium sp.]|nr:hypothetical protein [Methanohalobium sp.]
MYNNGCSFVELKVMASVVVEYALLFLAEISEISDIFVECTANLL